MKILIVDDNQNSSTRIRGILAAAKENSFLEVSDPKMAHQLMDFEIALDVALIDLRFVDSTNPAGHFDGFSICQKIRNTIPNAVIVGYSSSFHSDSEENKKLKENFLAMGADIVCALDHLTLTALNVLKQEFFDAKIKRIGSKIKPVKVFIGSSAEGLVIAQNIQAQLAHYYQVEIWNQTVFGLGDATIESLERATKDFQFSIFVFTADDTLTSRGETKKVPRDNVIFEAGLFIGSIGRLRSFVVKEQGNHIHLPSDLAGITTASYSASHENLAAAVGPACLSIKTAINRMQNTEIS